MSKHYKTVAKKLGVKYLFGRWGISFFSQVPEGDTIWHLRIIPLDGWSFDSYEIVEAMANDPDFSIKYSNGKSSNPQPPLTGKQKGELMSNIPDYEEPKPLKERIRLRIKHWVLK